MDEVHGATTISGCQLTRELVHSAVTMMVGAQFALMVRQFFAVVNLLL